MRSRGDPGSDLAANGWEFAGYLKAWHDHGPAALVGVVVDDYDHQPPAAEYLKKLGKFFRQLLENF